jgi:hypothetical protein
MAVRIQFRRDTASSWATENPVLAVGELGLVTDTGAYKVGDGVTAWNSLSYWALPAATGVLTMQASADPTAPAAGDMAFYAKAISGRLLPKFKGASGLDTPLQPAFFQNTVWMAAPNTTSSLSTLGGIVTSAGTVSTPIPTSASYGLSSNFATAATLNATAGTGSALAYFSTDSSAAGFFAVERLWWPDANYGTGATGARFFVGLTDQTMAVSVGADNPAGNRVGFALSTNLSETQWMLTTRNGTTETRVATGMSFAPNELCDFYLFFPPSGTELSWRINNLTTNTEVLGSTSATLPGDGVLMRAGFQIATLTTVARNVRMKKVYVETDY